MTIIGIFLNSFKGRHTVNNRWLHIYCYSGDCPHFARSDGIFQPNQLLSTMFLELNTEIGNEECKWEAQLFSRLKKYIGSGQILSSYHSALKWNDC